ncbi:hypothetical protein N8K70_01985 [Microbacterium betulae]|uniref:Transposase n=1 Tax=Microbacterium betulae TaxID=2981139 RepID=A0AA97FHQ5_9MICO|nr:hypothetical protein [Microbacterium sp. AB]WOF23471.1 hypothetical protein N8K70_01985 [Microbacterium sp. AB]
MAFERKYSDEVRTRSVETVLRRRQDEPRNRSIIREVAEEFDVGQQSLRQWLARYDDGSYDYGDDPSGAARYAGMSRADLIARVEELEQRVHVLDEDNRSLTRVVGLLSEQLRPSA